jgi:hypothetical protein
MMTWQVRSLEDDSPASWARGKGERRKTKPVLIERGTCSRDSDR